MIAEDPEARCGTSQACVATAEPTSSLHTDRRGHSKAGKREGQGARDSLQADVRGQLEGIFQYVELLDLPWLPGMNSPCYLKGPGIPLLSRTGLQEVFCGCSSLQLNKQL